MLRGRVRRTGQPVPELDPDPIVHAYAALWAAYQDLSAARQVGFGAPQPITWADIAAWQQCHRVQLTPWELGTLRAMDSAELAHYASRAAKQATPHHHQHDDDAEDE